MRTEDELRSALRGLERGAPAAEQVLRHVTERARRSTAGPGRRPGRRLIAGAAAAAAVTGIVVAVTQVTPPSRVAPPTARETLQSLPPYYLALVNSPYYAVVRDTVTGRTLATVRPPKGYDSFDWLSGAEDDQTFVLGAQSAGADEETQAETFYEARFNPASDKVTLTRLTLPALPVIDDMTALALSPDGTRLAVASYNPPQITVYALPSGTAKTWTAPSGTDRGALNAGPTDDLSWSSTGMLAYSWNTNSVYLLNTNTRAGLLLPDSRPVLCLPWSVSGATRALYAGYLTPDGTTIIAPVGPSVPVGQDPPSCRTPSGPQPTAGAGPPALEGFSLRTGQAISIISTRLPHGITLDSTIWWTNSSGRVLVMEGVTGDLMEVEGVFSGGEFFSIPGTSGGVFDPATPGPFNIYRLAF
jgi:hypothetical protein